uniref:Response regulatory domain-containing protein n=1 Tax=Lotharella globosa TaxID=91324 RepID=A0A7S4E1Y5_9EUKA
MEKNKYVIIFMDQEMKVPGDVKRQLDGHETLQRIRDRGVNCPVIMRTTRVDEQFIALYEQAGADLLLSKGVNPSALKKDFLPHLADLCCADWVNEELKRAMAMAGIVFLNKQKAVPTSPPPKPARPRKLHQDDNSSNAQTVKPQNRKKRKRPQVCDASHSDSSEKKQHIT